MIQDLYSKGVAETGLGGGRLSRAARAVEATAVRMADEVAVIHERFEHQAVDSLDLDPARVRVIRNWTHVAPVEPFDVDDFREGLGWEPSEAVILHAGAIGNKQGLENVVESGKLTDRRGAKIRFVLLGGGSQRANLEAAAECVESVQFLDQLGEEDFGRALRAADVLLVNEKPGVSEMAVPSKLTSYFSAERPVLAATQEGSTTAEELEKSGAGVRVDPGDPEALLTAALQMASDPVTSSLLAANGRRYSSEVLSEETAIKEYDRWVRHLAERYC